MGDPDLVKEVVAEVKDGGVGGEEGEGCQVSPGAVHPHCVAHILPWLRRHNVQYFLSSKTVRKWKFILTRSFGKVVEVARADRGAGGGDNRGILVHHLIARFLRFYLLGVKNKKSPAAVVQTGPWESSPPCNQRG